MEHLHQSNWNWLDSEDRILQLKQEVNALLQSAGQPTRYGVSGEQA